jgi:hypothetical protein
MNQGIPLCFLQRFLYLTGYKLLAGRNIQSKQTLNQANSTLPQILQYFGLNLVTFFTVFTG